MSLEDERKIGLLVAVAAVLLGVPGNAAEGLRPRCFGRAATIVGTRGDDRLVGTRGSDVIVGREGVDQIFGAGGDDLICAGPGFRIEPDEDTGGKLRLGDVVEAGEGDDRVHGGAHYDRIIGDGFPRREFGPPG